MTAKVNEETVMAIAMVKIIITRGIMTIIIKIIMIIKYIYIHIHLYYACV